MLELLLLILSLIVCGIVILVQMVIVKNNKNKALKLMAFIPFLIIIIYMIAFLYEAIARLYAFIKE